MLTVHRLSTTRFGPSKGLIHPGSGGCTSRTRPRPPVGSPTCLAIARRLPVNVAFDIGHFVESAFEEEDPYKAIEQVIEVTRPPALYIHLSRQVGRKHRDLDLPWSHPLHRGPACTLSHRPAHRYRVTRPAQRMSPIETAFRRAVPASAMTYADGVLFLPRRARRRAGNRQTRFRYAPHPTRNRASWPDF